MQINAEGKNSPQLGVSDEAILDYVCRCGCGRYTRSASATRLSALYRIGLGAQNPTASSSGPGRSFHKLHLRTAAGEADCRYRRGLKQPNATSAMMPVPRVQTGSREQTRSTPYRSVLILACFQSLTADRFAPKKYEAELTLSPFTCKSFIPLSMQHGSG